MKKISILILLSLLLSFIPPAAVQAQTTHTLEAVSCADYSIDYPSMGECEDLEPDEDTIIVEGYWNWLGNPDPYRTSFVDAVNAKIICTGSTCANDYPLYYKVEVSATTPNYWDYEKQIQTSEILTSAGGTGRTIIDTKYCGSLTTCALYIFEKKISASALYSTPTPAAGFHLGISFQIRDIPPGTYANYVWRITISTNPIDDDCVDNWLGADDGTVYDIPVTNQAGISAPVTELRNYKIQIFNGPWNDGTNNRTDSAYSTDGVNFTQAEKLQLDCKSQDEDEYYTYIVTPPAGTTHIYIRVNDSAGNFGNNTGTLSFRITEVIQLVECASQFDYDPGGEQIAAGDIAATSTGTNAATLSIGSWYVIETTAGAWQNGADPTDLYSIAARNLAGTYESLGFYEQSNCQSVVGNYVQVYFQANQENLYLRVNDAGGVFSDNSGSISYVIYATTYTRFPSVCEDIYEIADLVETKYVSGGMKYGILLDTKGAIKMEDVTGGGDAPVVSKWYALDVIGGPWYNAGVASYKAQFSGDDAYSWYALETHPDVTCAVQLDMMGRYRIYFQAAKDKIFKFRVDDIDFIGNTGTLGYTLYEVASTDYYDPVDIGTDTCDGHFTQGAQFWEQTVLATSEAGYVLTGYTAGDLISISTFNGPWNDGTNSRYDIAISGDNGSTWYPIWEYAGVSCAQSADGDHMTIYLTAQLGRIYRLRVNDAYTAGAFTFNTGNMLVKAYGSSHDIDPWYSCADNYQMRTINLNGSWGDFFNLPDFMSGVFDDNLYRFPIPEDLENGVQIGTPVLGVLQTGKTYAIKIVNGPWYDAPSTTDRFDAALSSDNGTTWVQIAPGMGECTVQNDAGSIMTFFTIGSGEKYRVRVNDDGALIDFASNLGSLEYQLYAAQDDTTDYGDDGGGVIPDWVLSCNQKCVRPSSILEVAAWLEYGRCQFTSYLSWCPEHTAALSYVNAIFADREPFGSIIEIASLVPYTQTEIDSYEWDTSDVPNFDTLALGGDGVGMINPLGFTNGLSESSPWMGGEIKFEQPALGGGEAMKNCSSNLTAIIGGSSSKLSGGYCFVLNVTKLYGVHLTILALEAIACGLYLFDYFNSRWMSKFGY